MNDLQAIKYLIEEEKLDVGYLSNDKENYLHILCQNNIHDCESIAKYFVEELKIDVEAKTKYG